MKNKETMPLAQYLYEVGKIKAEFLNLTKIVYPKDEEMINAAEYLSKQFEDASPNQEFLDGLRGFLAWATQTNANRNHVLTTLFHDLGEFNRNRHQLWFCPRTSMYGKYLTGASGA